MKYILFLLFLAGILTSTSGQELFSKKAYTHQDTLRGSITPQRAWWDLQHYTLSVAADPVAQSIKGSNVIKYKVLQAADEMQIDLQGPLAIESVTQDGKTLQLRHDGNAHFVKLMKPQQPGQVNEVTVTYSGKPHVAVHAPWDGGFTWGKDSLGNHFIATSCQGIGASLWWPCKDHMYDEPDQGMQIILNVPENLVAVSNGRLKKEVKEKNKTKTYTWEVVNPINNYGINLNVGNYVHFGEKYQGEKGPLDMDYWVLKQDLEKAKVHFKDAPRMMKAFEHWFGPYPFYEDSYKLVQVPYLGMEHQSSVTYGNGFQNGYLGQDLSYTGWGLKWDYIIIHESGHEWFANNITYKDIADMWVHEGFTMYSESLFVEYYYGKDAGAEYSRGVRLGIQNKEPIIGDYDVNHEGSSDMYNKGNNMLHTLRQIVNNDDKWREMLRGLGKTFYHQVVTTKQIEDYMASTLGLKLDAFFDQYLRESSIPVLEYWSMNGRLIYHWSNCIDSFDMPVKVWVDGKERWLKPTTEIKVEDLGAPAKMVKVDPDFYVYSFDIMGK